MGASSSEYVSFLGEAGSMNMDGSVLVWFDVACSLVMNVTSDVEESDDDDAVVELVS